MAIGFHSIDNSILDSQILDSTYFTIFPTMTHTQWINNTVQFTYEPIEYGYWNENDLPGIDQKVFQRANFSNYLCLKTNDYYLKSDQNGDQSSYITIFVSEWSNSTFSSIICKTEEEIDNFMGSLFVNIATISGYFDFDDYQQPIKTYLNDYEQVYLNSAYYQQYDFKIKQNKALISDNLIFSNGFDNKHFYTVETPRYRLFNNDLSANLVMTINLRLSRESEQYERIVYTFFDLFGYLGGLFDFLYFIGYIWVRYFNDKYYIYTMLTKLYQVEQSTMRPTNKLFNDNVDVSIAPKKQTMTRTLNHAKPK